MRPFEQIFALAADRHGGPDALEERLAKPLPPEELARIPTTAGSVR
ncbi:MAG: hypothetical protein R3D85_16990 [Paracoccaceae bacterium]